MVDPSGDHSLHLLDAFEVRLTPLQPQNLELDLATLFLLE